MIKSDTEILAALGRWEDRALRGQEAKSLSTQSASNAKGVSTGNIPNQRRKFSSHGLNEPKVSQSRMLTSTECGDGKAAAGHTVSN